MADRIQVKGRRRELHHASLDQARLEVAAVKKLAASGIDPVEERRAAEIVIPTFEVAAKLAHAELVKGWTTGKHTKR